MNELMSLRHQGYVQVIGWLEKYHGRTYIKVKRLRWIQDPHETLFHFFNCMADTVVIERGPAPLPERKLPHEYNPDPVASSTSESSFVHSPPLSPPQTLVKLNGPHVVMFSEQQRKFDSSDDVTLEGLSTITEAQGTSPGAEYEDNEVIDLCADDSSSDVDCVQFSTKRESKVMPITIRSPKDMPFAAGPGALWPEEISDCVALQPSCSSSSIVMDTGSEALESRLSSFTRANRRTRVSPRSSGQKAAINRNKDVYFKLPPLHREIIFLILNLTQPDSASLYPALAATSVQSFIGAHIDIIVEKIIAKWINVNKDELIEAIVSLKDNSFIYETIDEFHFCVTL